MTQQERKIRDVMTPNPRTVEPSTPVQEAAKLMREEDVGPIPIVESGSVAGIVTDRDIVLKVVAEGSDPSSTPVSDIASRDLVTVDPDQSLDDALRLMAQHQVRRLPVVEEDGRLVGIVAQADIARAADDQRTGEVVEEISK
ncbi:MAG TPA: CBS domain-containing protein [Gaiellaceae bacterium]|nr:CBS domain-containing protein [Gaiellaceae bacterium]